MFVIAIGVACTASAQESVTIALPTTVTFSVPDVSSATPADLAPVTVQFSGAVLNPSRVLRISVIADSSTLAGPGANVLSLASGYRSRGPKMCTCVSHAPGGTSKG